MISIRVLLKLREEGCIWYVYIGKGDDCQNVFLNQDGVFVSLMGWTLNPSPFFLGVASYVDGYT